MKTSVKTTALALIVVLCTSGAFAKSSGNHGHSKQEKVVTTTTVTTKTTTTNKSKVKNHPKKVSKAESEHHEEYRKRPNPNNRRHKNHHDEHLSEKPHFKPECSRPEHGPAPVVRHRHGERRPNVVVVERHRSRPVTVVEPVIVTEPRPSCVVEVDPAAVAAGAIVGGIIALTAIAAD